MGSFIQIPAGMNPVLAIEIAKAHHKSKGAKLVISKGQHDYFKKQGVWDKLRDYAEVEQEAKA